MKYLLKAAFLTILVSPFSMANSVLDELAICAQNVNPTQRLACFDKLVKNNQSLSKYESQQDVLDANIPAKLNIATQKIPPEPIPTNLGSIDTAPTALPQPKVVTTAHQQAIFGQEHKLKTEDLIERLQAKITQVKKAHRGELIITLDNGQVWRQADNTRLKLKSGQVVEITRGALGSFFISKENTNRRIRAKRVK